jgi:Aromatic-ring-opening dioxygenase LigAB, LigA subunit
MSLYQLSKLLFHLNRDEDFKRRFKAEPQDAIAPFGLSDDERRAVLEPDIGLLYVLGVNGQILMHFAAFSGIEWSDYLQRMRDGVKQHGPVRAGIYAMLSDVDEKVAGS